MFKEYLKKDLKAIFETKSVDFANAVSNFGSELGCLLVVIDQEGVKNNFQDGENYFAVVGSIERENGKPHCLAFFVVFEK